MDNVDSKSIVEEVYGVKIEVEKVASSDIVQPISRYKNWQSFHNHLLGDVNNDDAPDTELGGNDQHNILKEESFTLEYMHSDVNNNSDTINTTINHGEVEQSISV